MPYFEILQQRTEAARAGLFAVPVIRDCLAGRVTRAQYIAFLTEAYHHVKHTVPLLMACGSRLPESAGWLRSAVAEYIAEEHGHEEWILNDIAACGADAEAVRSGTPLPATELMVAYVYDYIARRNPVGFFGMVHVLEGTSVALALNAAGHIQTALGLPTNAFTYLRSHGELDKEHINDLGAILERLTDEGDRQAVVRCARGIYWLYGQMFRGLETAVPMMAAGAQRKSA
jgi:pyrroloquinoline quinone (PQQ) biosynthesis protein C